MKRFYLVFMLLISFRLFAQEYHITTDKSNNLHIDLHGNDNKVDVVMPRDSHDNYDSHYTKTYFNIGISFIVIGPLIAAGGATGFFIGSKKESDKYENMTTSSAIQNAVNSGEDKTAYINKAEKHRDKSNIYKYCAIASLVVGGATAITGTILTVLDHYKKNNNAKDSVKNLSVMPVNKGFYASLSLNF